MKSSMKPEATIESDQIFFFFFYRTEAKQNTISVRLICHWSIENSMEFTPIQFVDTIGKTNLILSPKLSKGLQHWILLINSITIFPYFNYSQGSFFQGWTFYHGLLFKWEMFKMFSVFLESQWLF